MDKITSTILRNSTIYGTIYFLYKIKNQSANFSKVPNITMNQMINNMINKQIYDSFIIFFIFLLIFVYKIFSNILITVLTFCDDLSLNTSLFSNLFIVLAYIEILLGCFKTAKISFKC